ncbi:hypothetical protein JH06_3017 [Blastocystis sp. subtype 4]|uniref:hypothetical protein n=1 Tax=Blastocystis sp. subtype 4 TaxID=944170 RepID=UPI0007116872|nr:hypothetical protein JH06_3017 [Blastocystis sp. subtype 4]KNB43268.1 hypothetical protein JH06_3017 [Blastocystis sp. subtype 4]|eukprot:XP_014526711.1 hypothetical protein JH06_3017 [Blastocystis sp. subtype 4]
MNRFVEYRRKDDEVFHRHCDAILKAHVMKTHNAEGEKEGEDDIMDRREQLLQTRNTIQERTGELKKLLNDINGFIAEGNGYSIC